MCDCYNKKCSFEDCQEILPINIDWKVNRDEIEVFCSKHIPEENCRIFTLGVKTVRYGVIFPRNWKIGFRSLTESSIENKNQILPDLGPKILFDVEDI